MPSTREKAKTARAARWNLEPAPLDEQQSDWYVDLQSLIGLKRGGRSALVDNFDPAHRPAGTWLHFALAGPRGSGKSTLVQQSFAAYRQLHLHPVHVDVLDALDPSNISYSDLLLTMVAAIDESLASEELFIDHRALEEVLSWFRERAFTEEHTKELGLELRTTAEAGARVPFLGKLLAKVTASFKGGSKYREEIRQKIEARPDELVAKVNFYLDAATQAVEKGRGRKEIVLFFDNLEKVTNAPKQVDAALIQRASLFRRLRVHAIYTIPLGLLSEPEQGGLPGDAFTIAVVPMVALRSRDDARDKLDSGVLPVFRTILEKRLDVTAVFETPAVVDVIVRASGGCPRDLLRVAQLACDYAGDAKVSAQHVQEAIRRAGQEHVRTALKGDWKLLAVVHRDKRILNDADHHRLIYHRLVLHYDDIVWDDVHPLVWGDDRFTRAWEATGGIAAR